MQQPGGLSPAGFEAGLAPFAAWWASAVAAAGADAQGHLLWRVEHATMPVSRRRAPFLVMERPVAAAPAPPAAPAPAPPALSPAALEPADSGEDDDAVAAAAATAAAAAATTTTTPAVAAVHEYSVALHEGYGVPALYVRAFAPDGSCLPLDALLDALPALRPLAEPGARGDGGGDGGDRGDGGDDAANEWAQLTPVAHPLTRAPVFMVHPCGTAARMALLLLGAACGGGAGDGSEAGCESGGGGGAGGDDAARRGCAYLVAWARMVAAPLLGLRLPADVN